MSCLSSADQIDLCDGHGVILLHQSLFTIAPACLSINAVNWSANAGKVLSI